MKIIPSVISNKFGGKERGGYPQKELSPSRVPDASEIFSQALFILATQDHQDVLRLNRRIRDQSIHVTFIEGTDLGLFYIAVGQKDDEIGADLAVFVDSTKFMAVKGKGRVVMDIAFAVEAEVQGLALRGVPLNRRQIDPLQLLRDAGVRLEGPEEK